MKWSRAHAGATRPAKDRGNICAPAITALGRIVGQQIEAAGNKIDELKLSDRLHAHQPGATRGADDRSFRNWRVDNALRAKVIDEAFSYFESAAINAYVFTNQKDSWVAFHLFPKALTNSFNHGCLAAA